MTDIHEVKVHPPHRGGSGCFDHVALRRSLGTCVEALKPGSRAIQGSGWFRLVL